ncbi:MAG: 16S rRNA (adenine(1518)-N(6)/adenine(1519)-N(6))-dimethyltransferase RsmA [Candidatus Omnitrophota bacterium]|nr:16S rRNA (adenine(1518)-N(6)/adenine(1519)-N(6))-dimethyltransferase RsmA [Candidatus Omnitrophota bacterium]
MPAFMTQIELLKKYQIPVRGQLGQHLLIDPNIQQKIVDLLDPQPDEWVLEIGPGLGALTQELLSRGVKVLAIEKDKRFVKVLEEENAVRYAGKFTLLTGDVLRLDLGRSIEENIPDSKLPIKVLSNLPYYITAPILVSLLDNDRLFSRAVLTMQKEVAARLLAQPGTKDYGRLTLAVRLLADVKLGFAISRHCFTPRPAVESTVLSVFFHRGLEKIPDLDRARLLGLIKLAFGKRRKMLLAVLFHEPSVGRTRSELAAIFDRLGIAEQARGEELMAKDFIALARALWTFDKKKSPC